MSLSHCSHFHPQPRPVEDFRPFIRQPSRPSTVNLAQRFDTRLEIPSGAHVPFYSPSSTFSQHIPGAKLYRPETRNGGDQRLGWVRGAFNKGLNYVADEATSVGPAAYSIEKALSATRHRSSSVPVIGDTIRFSVNPPVSLLAPGSFNPTLYHKR